MADEKPAPVEAPKEPQEPKDQPAPRVYSQEEVDRIADKVRRNAKRDAELRVRREVQTASPPPREEEKKDPPADPDPAPKRDDFDDYESFQVAIAEHAGRKAAREERVKQQKEDHEKAQREQHEKAARTWHGKIEQAQAKLADFEDVLEDNAETLGMIGNAPMREFIAESDIGPQIIYELCKAPDEAKRIAALPKYKQAAEIAKIEEKLLAADKPADGKGDEEDPKGDDDGEEKPTTARAADGTFRKEKTPPPPIEPGSGRPASSSSLPSDKDDPETWRRKELARMAKLRAGK